MIMRHALLSADGAAIPWHILRVNRAWFREAFRLSIHDRAVNRALWQADCNRRVRSVIGDPSLSGAEVLQRLVEELSKTPDIYLNIGIDACDPEEQHVTQRQEKNGVLALVALSRLQSHIKTLRLDTREFDNSESGGVEVAANRSTILISTVATTLERNPELEDIELELGWSGIHEQNVAALMGCMPGKPVSTLDLSGNYLSEEGAKAIAEHLPFIALKDLALCECELEDAGVRALIGALVRDRAQPQSDYLEQLKTLKLRLNDVTDEGAADIVAALGFTELELVDLRHNKITEAFDERLKAKPPRNALGERVRIKIFDDV